jgi:hypothetical protein
MIINPVTAATIGFSLSPGGLLYPYHIGGLASLEYHQHLTPHTPIAGSSAGAIAVASHAAQVKPELCLDVTTKISEECMRQGGARGRLLPLLEAELDGILGEHAHEIVNERPGMTALAYYELFPLFRPRLETHFETRECLIEAILNSSMFPFFSTNMPWRLSKNTNSRQKKGMFASFPRFAMDGYFAVPFGRFGCPDFQMAEGNPSFAKDVLRMEDEVEDELKLKFAEKVQTEIDRTVTVSVFPHESVLLTASSEHDRISPQYDPENPVGQVKELLRLATEPLTEPEVHRLYEEGWADAERWVVEEAERVKMREASLREDARKSWLVGRGDLEQE